MFNEKGGRLKAHTLFIQRVLYSPISHSNEHRLHILLHAPVIYYTFLTSYFQIPVAQFSLYNCKFIHSLQAVVTVFVQSQFEVG